MIRFAFLNQEHRIRKPVLYPAELPGPLRRAVLAASRAFGKRSRCWGLPKPWPVIRVSSSLPPGPSRGWSFVGLNGFACHVNKARHNGRALFNSSIPVIPGLARIGQDWPGLAWRPYAASSAGASSSVFSPGTGTRLAFLERYSSSSLIARSSSIFRTAAISRAMRSSACSNSWRSE